MQRFKTLNSYSEEEASLRLATYRKIIVVRDPLERLASAWTNKFVYMPKRNGYWGWVKSLNYYLRIYRERKLPDKINYDFIAHTDTIASDVRLFLKKNNITANEDILPEQRQRQANDDNVFGGIYGQVPIEDILPLRDIFQEDFDMFGYSFEQDLAKILEEKAKV
ncbi:PREDICTED: carbohydrate sulfotransferase 9-like [Branchiostoma belcheri]|uniref:Carbohydrate sulfotransferase n=1 Tax=Branchiostoma belcheri TaxID=7741 RepID=A0A6P4Y967_BRABE|nr:PREDICTED: carbohydrate sulfotransferase 9-like [Branchiostoma belcheri]